MAGKENVEEVGIGQDPEDEGQRGDKKEGPFRACPKCGASCGYVHKKRSWYCDCCQKYFRKTEGKSGKGGDAGKVKERGGKKKQKKVNSGVKGNARKYERKRVEKASKVAEYADKKLAKLKKKPKKQIGFIKTTIAKSLPDLNPEEMNLCDVCGHAAVCTAREMVSKAREDGGRDSTGEHMLLCNHYLMDLDK